MFAQFYKHADNYMNRQRVHGCEGQNTEIRNQSSLEESFPPAFCNTFLIPNLQMSMASSKYMQSQDLQLHARTNNSVISSSVACLPSSDSGGVRGPDGGQKVDSSYGRDRGKFMLCSLRCYHKRKRTQKITGYVGRKL